MTAWEKILKKTLVASDIPSSEWNKIQSGVRDCAFFSSTVTEMNILDEAQKIAAEYAKGGRDLSALRIELEKFIKGTGYTPDPKVAGTIKDLTSKARLDAIIKTNVAKARGFIQYAEGMTPGAFAAFPAQEFTRIEHRNQPRTTWPQRWKNAGGKIYGGRMIAPKGDPVWTRLSIFGEPFPPFDWGSGMGVMDVSRKEALELGVMTEDEIDKKREDLRTQEKDGSLPSISGNLQAEIQMRKDSPEFEFIQKRLNDKFGDQVQIVNDKLKFTDSMMLDVYRGKIKKARMGLPSPQLEKMMQGVIPQEDIDVYMKMNPGFSKSVFDAHAVKHDGDNEVRGTNIPLKESDFGLLAYAWRNPHKVIPVKNHHMVLEIEAFDGGFVKLSVNTMRGFSSFYKTKEPLEATPGYVPFDPFKNRRRSGQAVA